MNHVPSIEQIRTEEQWSALSAFAKSFGHKADDRTLPIHGFIRDGRLRAYAQIHTETPLAFTAWHTDPEICTVKDVLYGMTYLKGWAKINKGGGLLGVPMNSPNFTPEVMEKLNMKRLGLELYQTGE